MIAYKKKTAFRNQINKLYISISIFGRKFHDYGWFQQKLKP